MAAPNVLRDETAPNTLRGGPTTRAPGMAANTMDGRGPTAASRMRPGVSLVGIVAGLIVAGLVAFFLLNQSL